MARDRTFWRRFAIGIAVTALLAVVGYVAVRFVAVLVFTVFLYYAVRPIYRFLERFGLPRRVRALLALVLFGIPFVILIAYTLTVVVLETQAFLEAYDLQDQLVDRAVTEIGVDDIDLNELQELVAGGLAQASVTTLLFSLAGTIGLVSGALVRMLLLVVLTYYLLVDGPHFVSWLLETYDESGVLEAYVRAVDPELSLTLFGNIVNVFVTAIVGLATFYAYNAFAPAAVQVPFPALVGALAGIGSLIPVVGIKLVYVPVTLVLAANALLEGDPSLLVPVAVLFGVSAVVVDFIPDFFIRAHISGEGTHTGLLLVAYVVGPIAFGFYGLFLLPIVLILVTNALRVLMPYVLSGEHPETRQSRLPEFESAVREATDGHRRRVTARPSGDDEG